MILIRSNNGEKKLTAAVTYSFYNLYFGMSGNFASGWVCTTAERFCGAGAV